MYMSFSTKTQILIKNSKWNSISNKTFLFKILANIHLSLCVDTYLCLFYLPS